MFRPQNISITGFQIADADDTIAKDIRGGVLPALATITEESHVGWEDWNLIRPGDHGNFMWWPLDPSGAPTPRGPISGSYSYAIPARKMKAIPGEPFLPLQFYDSADADYELLSIPEAKPDDWIVLATVGHGTREKIAFRSGQNPLLIADHRSAIAPQLSSIVHDGKGLSHDTVRKAGLHTAWEVREYAVPGSQANPYGGTSSQPFWKAGDPPQKYALSWVGDTAPDSTGYCNIGFGDRTALFSHMVSGPFIPSLVEKHWLGDTNDGPEISGAIWTQGYFRGSGMPFSAPLDFEEKYYPNPADSTYEYKVFLWYDKKRDHQHFTGRKEGLWRWFTRIPIGETPKCSPTKDYSTTDSNGNPRRTFAEDSRAVMHKKLVSPGIYFTPRPNLIRGRIPGTVTTHV